MKIRKIEHIGLACRSVQDAEKFYSDALGLPVVERETLEDQKLKIVKVAAGESVLELLQPLDGELIISKFLATRGEGVHHVCFEVDDVNEATAELRAKGYQPLWDQPRPGAGGRRVNFLRPKDAHGVLIELNQPPAAGESGKK